MSRLGSIVGDLFGPDLPRWACELTATHAVALGVAPDRRGVTHHASVPLPAGALKPDPKEPNVTDVDAVTAAIGRALSSAGFGGSEIALVIPDEAVRIALLKVDTFPADTAERQRFIRWKLKKNVPFDVENARVAWQKIDENGGVDLLVALSPHAVSDQYAEIMDGIGLHAGIISPSTTAAANLLAVDGDVLFVKAAPDAVTTSLVIGGKLRFYRKVARVELEEAVYPTVMYYQDKLAGTGIAALIVCGAGRDEAEKAGARLSLPVRNLSPAEIEDIYKPALGALQT